MTDVQKDIRDMTDEELTQRLDAHNELKHFSSSGLFKKSLKDLEAEKARRTPPEKE